MTQPALLKVPAEMENGIRVYPPLSGLLNFRGSLSDKGRRVTSVNSARQAETNWLFRAPLSDSYHGEPRRRPDEETPLLQGMFTVLERYLCRGVRST